MSFQVIEENLRHSFRVLARSGSKGEVREMPGVTIASAGVTFQMFNAAFLSAPVAGERELDRRIVMAKVHFGARGLAWSYWVCEDWLDRKARRALAGACKRHGLYLATVLPGMEAERLKPPVRALPAIDVRAVTDEATWASFCQIGALCFNVPIDWFQEVFQDRRLWQNGFAGYVGYFDGEAVTTTATVVSGGAIGVYNVATVPSHQRRGYGEAVMRFALERAREKYGLERSVLQSTEQGFPLYQRMGYAAVTNVAVYTS